MTMLSPLGRVPKRRPPKRRGRRRVQPAYVALAVLVLIAIVVWWRVFHPGDRGSAAGCAPRPKAGLSTMDPHEVRVRVYNSTDRSGLAKSASDALRKRGFRIETTSNDPIRAERNVEGEGEIRYGELGAQQALFLSFQFPGVQMVEDPRTDAIVDIALGPKFTKLATPEQVKQAAAAAEANAKANDTFGSAGC
jgi:LytR cell envelope-related transcriptional attenuator